ncbi:hypothetical protein ES705_40977 [subsurface metagenome]
MTAVTAVIAVIFLALFLTYALLFYGRDPVVVEEIKIPPVENMPVDSARQTLLFFDLEMEIIEEIYSETIPDKYIIKQDPETNGDVPADRTVKVMISMGSKTPGILVPNILGLELEEARGILEAMGLRTGLVSGKYSEESARDYEGLKIAQANI